METFFACPERSSYETVVQQFRLISDSPFISGLLHTVCGLLAVLNGNRQIVALNDTFMSMLGIEDPEDALGLRPGEALRCVHVDESPSGCGTSKFCSSCGAALSIVAALGENEPAERICALTHMVDDFEVETAFLVSARPVTIGDEKYVLIFLQDITDQQRRAALERTFFHDFNNVLSGMLHAGELLEKQCPSPLTSIIRKSILRLSREIDIQRLITSSGNIRWRPTKEVFSLNEFLWELETFFETHPSATEKELVVRYPVNRVKLETDYSILFRILVNMIINGFEASHTGSPVTVRAETSPGRCTFTVHNLGLIPEDDARRIFQRNFSTKPGPGRGFGTYSMKLLGEGYLGGRVSFTTSKENGTEFSFSFPTSIL